MSNQNTSYFLSTDTPTKIQNKMLKKKHNKIQNKMLSVIVLINLKNTH